MHAIIRQGNGRYYTSAVLGIYRGQTQNGFNSDIFIVFNEQKNRLIAVPQSQVASDNSIQTNILVFETKTTNWKFSDSKRRYGGVVFLPKDRAAAIVEAGKMPSHGDTITTECEIEDKSIKLEKWTTIRKQHDIENLLAVSGRFHDAYVAECQRDKRTGAIRALLKDCWGADIELIFEGDAECRLHNPEETQPWWFDCTLIAANGLIYLFDNDNTSPESFDNWSSDCFRAKQLHYRIIPH